MFKTIDYNKGNFAILLLFVASIAVWSGYLCLSSSDIQAVFSLWALGGCVAFTALKNVGNLHASNLEKFFAFLLLIAGGFAGYFQLLHFALFFVSVAYVLFFCGIKPTFICVLPLAIWILGVPNYSNVHITVSYPMRVLETIIAKGILMLLSFDTTSQGTSLYVENKQIIITTACSGVEHLWTLFLLAWLSAMVMFKQYFLRAIYFLCIIPIFIFCNATRVVLSVVGMKLYGDKILEGDAHFALGLFAIIFTMILFVGFGLFLRKIEDERSDYGK